MKRNLRGAARVSLVWLIAAVVVIIACLFMVFVAYDDKAKSDEALQDALAAAQDADERQAVATEGWTDLSEAIGWYDAAAATPRTNVDALKTSFDSIRATIPDLGDDIKDLATALPVVETAYKARGREIQQLKDDLARIESEKKALEQSLREASSQKDTQIADLNRQIQDEAENATQKQTELEDRVENLRQQNSELDSQTRTLRAELEDVARMQADEKQLWAARFNEMKASLEIPNEPETADGSVLQVAADSSTGYIDLGRKHRLAPGMRFRVTDGERRGRTKGWALVTDVDVDMARVEFSELADRFEPIVQGDELCNPVYDPRAERDAVLVGRFSGKYNERELTALLAGIGIRVQQKLDLATDYLIVGAELYVDEEGEPYEEPVSPSELPVYKDAEANGVQIVALKDLQAYFKN